MTAGRATFRPSLIRQAFPNLREGRRSHSESGSERSPARRPPIPLTKTLMQLMRKSVGGYAATDTDCPTRDV